MNRPSHRCLALPAIIVLLTLGIVGCGKEKLSVVPVTGVVTIDKKPLADAEVVFVSEKGQTASAKTGADGRYNLGASEQGTGAAPGRNMVTVTKREPGPAASGPPGPLSVPLKGPSLIPESYSNSGTSGLEFNVTEGQENTYNIDLFSRRR